MSLYRLVRVIQMKNNMKTDTELLNKLEELVEQVNPSDQDAEMLVLMCYQIHKDGEAIKLFTAHHAKYPEDSVELRDLQLIGDQLTPGEPSLRDTLNKL